MVVELGKIHEAGRPTGRFQKCLHCGKVLAEDDPNAQAPVGQSRGSRFWAPGPVTFYGESSGVRQAGIGEEAVACTIPEAS